MDQALAQSAAVSQTPASAGSVLLLAPQPFFLNRGTPMNVRAIAETLSAAGYQVDLLVFPYGEEIEIPGVRLMRCKSCPGVRSVPIGPSYQKVLLDLLLFCSAIRLMLSKRYSILHGIEEGAFMVGALGLFGRVPFVFDMDSSMRDQLRNSTLFGSNTAARCIAVLERFFLPRAKAVLTVCTALSEHAREVHPELPIYQIEDFAEERIRWPQPAGAVERLRREFNIADDEKVILYTGNFERYQGLSLLLAAFAEVWQRRCELAELEPETGLKLLLVGGGELDGPHIASYIREAERWGIADRVVFTGNRPAEQMPVFMHTADVLVSPRCEGENTPLKIYNYMASGRPIVATRIYSHTQVLTDEHAYLAEPQPSSFAAALLAALDDTVTARNQRRERVQCALHLAERRYSRTSFEERLRAMYADIAA